MSAAQDHVTKESYDLVSTESFAINVANYRSLLLTYEKEVQSSPTDGKRAALIFKEVSMLQEIIGDQISRAGADVKMLGVPPESMREVVGIYQRVVRLLAINYASKYDNLFNAALDAYVSYVEQWADAPEVQRNFIGQLKMARLTIYQVYTSPDAASLIAPALIGIVDRLNTLWPLIKDSIPVEFLSTVGAPPNRPPVTPPVAEGDGKGENGKMEQRVNKLETAVEHLQKDTAEIKGEIKDFRRETKGEFADLRREVKGEFSDLRRDSRADFTTTRSDMRTDFRVGFGATIAVALGLAAMMAKGFHWI
ncbi:MAG: hypothetical protein V4858_03175 [Pseudomonadota bacterium]